MWTFLGDLVNVLALSLVAGFVYIGRRPMADNRTCEHGVPYAGSCDDCQADERAW